jgi:two-component sensor histidine kinase
MRQIILFFIFYTASMFSQDIEYKKAQDFLNRNKIDSASIVIQKVLKKSNKINSKLNLLYAQILKNNNKIDSCYYYLDLSEKDFSNRKINDSLIYTYALKAELFRFAVRKKESFDYLKKIDLFGIKKIKDFNIKAYCLNRKMGIYNHLSTSPDTIKIATDLGNEILKLEKKVSDKDIIAYTLNELAHIEYHHHNRAFGLEKYELALEYAIKNKLVISNIDIHMNLARIYSSGFNNHKKAIELLENILPLAESNKNLHQIYHLYMQLSNHYVLIGNYQKAYLYKSKSHDSFLQSNNDIVNTKLAEFEKKYNLSKKENELKNKENEIILKNNELKNNKKTTLLLSITFLITLLAVFTLLYYYRKINKYNKQLEKLSEENEFLLSEANHRINNNLQLIIILISEQLKKMPLNEQVIINNILAKIESIATLHKHLYKSNDISKIDLEKYLNEIVINLHEVFENNNIETNFLINKVLTTPDNAMYYGLLLTELCINSVKHAFTEDSEIKKIEFEFSSKEENSIHFRYFDNGSNSKNQIVKPKLVDKICRQLKINYKIDTENGFLFTFTKNN